MISSISNMTSAMAMRTGNSQQPPPPPDKGAFKVADSDGDGLVSSSELESVVSAIAETTGTTLNVDETLSTYDTDQDGGLSGEEMFALMSDSGFGPPQGIGGDNGGPPPPPPASTDEAMAAYARNSGGDMITQLLDILQGSSEEAGDSSSVDTTS